MKRKKYEEKENIKVPVKRQQSSIILFCLIKEDVPAHAFPVKINKEETIGELKDAIKEKINISVAKDLKLWKVKIPDDYNDDLDNLLLSLVEIRNIGHMTNQTQIGIIASDLVPIGT